MAFRIMGTNHGERVLEYVLKLDNQPTRFSWCPKFLSRIVSECQYVHEARGNILDSLASVFLKDYEYFHMLREVETLDNSSNVLFIFDPAKDNLSACVRVDDTLYPHFKKLRIVSDDLDKVESLYGSLVRVYIDSRVREALPSVEKFPEAVE